MDIEIDLQAQIECLRQRKTELETYYWNPPSQVSEAERAQVSFLITQIADRKAALEEIARHHQSGRIVVSEPTAEQVAAIQGALSALNTRIQQEQSFTDVLRTTTNVLGAAHTIGLAGSGAKPA